ncbi:MAG: hypothetical protein ABJ015_06575, partial [Rhodopirellula bahusiensis]
VDQRRLNLHLVGDLGNRNLIDKVLSDGGSLVSSRERASFSCHCEISSGENSSPLADFQFQERQHRGIRSAPPMRIPAVTFDAPEADTGAQTSLLGVHRLTCKSETHSLVKRLRLRTLKIG